MDDNSILTRIKALVDEEHALRAASATADTHPASSRLQHLEENLDQCWDLLRQRKAKAEYGANPDEATVRPVAVVEGYWPK